MFITITTCSDFKEITYVVTCTLLKLQKGESQMCITVTTCSDLQEITGVNKNVDI